MIDSLAFLAAPMALAALLVGIHAYLGLHVLRREVIFVDISLSQVAALGAAFSLFFFPEGSSQWISLGFSLIFCLTVAFALALLKHSEKSVSQEAIIGMTYALASGALIVLADRLPHGAEHLKEALVGNILFVTWDQVALTFGIYLVIGLLHWFFRDGFWKASRGEQGTFWWDFLFYLLFGIVITFSTRHAGVLVVFSILVAPAALGKRFRNQIAGQLAFAWFFGFLGLLLAFLLSYYADLPSGPAIVCTLTTGFFMSLIFPTRASAKD